MSELTPPFRRATGDDAQELAELSNMAGDGLGVYICGKLAQPGQSAWDVGRERARLGLGNFAHANTVIREVDGKVAALLIGYPLSDSPKGEEPPPAIAAILAPLLELQALMPESWYINVLATYPEHRGKGFASELLHVAESQARETRCKSLSLIAFDTNTRARRLYESNGYTDHATRPIVKGDWDHPGQNWLLMVKDL